MKIHPTYLYTSLEVISQRTKQQVLDHQQTHTYNNDETTKKTELARMMVTKSRIKTLLPNNGTGNTIQQSQISMYSTSLLLYLSSFTFKRGVSPTTKPANLDPNLMAKVHPRPVLHNTWIMLQIYFNIVTPRVTSAAILHTNTIKPISKLDSFSTQLVL